VEEEGKPGFFAIASPPNTNKTGVLELLVKSQPGSAAEAICGLQEGSDVKVSPVMVGAAAPESARQQQQRQAVGRRGRM